MAAAHSVASNPLGLNACTTNTVRDKMLCVSEIGIFEAGKGTDYKPKRGGQNYIALATGKLRIPDGEKYFRCTIKHDGTCCIMDKETRQLYLRNQRRKTEAGMQKGHQILFWIKDPHFMRRYAKAMQDNNEHGKTYFMRENKEYATLENYCEVIKDGSKPEWNIEEDFEEVPDDWIAVNEPDDHGNFYGFLPLGPRDYDEETKTVVFKGNNKYADKWHHHAMTRDGTGFYSPRWDPRTHSWDFKNPRIIRFADLKKTASYELVGPKVQGGKYTSVEDCPTIDEWNCGNPRCVKGKHGGSCNLQHYLVEHGSIEVSDMDWDFATMKQFITEHDIEGLVFHGHEGTKYEGTKYKLTRTHLNLPECAHYNMTVGKPRELQPARVSSPSNAKRESESESESEEPDSEEIYADEPASEQVDAEAETAEVETAEVETAEVETVETETEEGRECILS